METSISMCVNSSRMARCGYILTADLYSVYPHIVPSTSKSIWVFVEL